MAAATRACKYCGLSGLAWTQIGGRFRLKDPRTGELHTCIGAKPGEFGPTRPIPVPPTSSAPSLKDLADLLDDNNVVVNTSEPPEPEGPSILATLLAEL
jgi:hypothetical protein